MADRGDGGAAGDRTPDPLPDVPQGDRPTRVQPTAEARAKAYAITYDPFDYDFGNGSGAVVPLDDYDLGMR